MVQSAILGFPRMGVNRDLKKATEACELPASYSIAAERCFDANSPLDWAGKLSQADLLAEAKRLRLAHWKIQKDAGVDIIPSNDFALYDQVLCHIQDFGVSERRYPDSRSID